MKSVYFIKMISCFLMAFIFFQVGAQVINVPGDQPTIQSAVDVSQSGDTVLVANGEYFENINFRNKNIVVCSHFIFGYNIQDIYNTIINGSLPVNPDSASCVIIAGGQDSTTVLQGFTLTGGSGTLWEDEHGPGHFYTEGGGILIQYSAPTICNNIITQNTAVNVPAGATSAGGGAIRCGDGNPHINNNIFTYNQGKYGAGLVLNYSGAVIKNNVFAFNTGGEHYGGGGLWCLSNSTSPVVIVNNTIVMNHSATGGGGIRLWSCAAQLKNNVIWGNTAASNPQIQGFSGTVTYCCVEGGWTGEGNIDEEPELTGNNFIPGANSPCIDHGDPEFVYNDPEDPDNPGYALFPAQGALINDMGAYGGPFCMGLPEVLTGIKEGVLPGEVIIVVSPNPVTQDSFTVELFGEISPANSQLILSEISGKILTKRTIPSDGRKIVQSINGLSNGIYLLIVVSQKQVVCSQKLVLLRR